MPPTAPTGPSTQTCAQCKVNPHIRGKTWWFSVCAASSSSDKQKAIQSKRSEKCSAAKRFEGNGWLLSEQFWIRATKATNTAYHLCVLLAVINKKILDFFFPTSPSALLLSECFSQIERHAVSWDWDQTMLVKHGSKEVCWGPLCQNNRWWTTQN